MSATIPPAPNTTRGATGAACSTLAEKRRALGDQGQGAKTNGQHDAPPRDRAPDKMEDRPRPSYADPPGVAK